MKGSLRHILLGIVVLGLLVQVVLGVASQWEVLLTSPGRTGTVERSTDLAPFLAFVGSHVAPGSDVLYVTPVTEGEKRWGYIQLSYRLYPSTVWWATPAAKVSPMDFWVPSTLTGESLGEVARSKEAAFVVLNGLPVPEGMVASAVYEFSPDQLVLELP